MTIIREILVLPLRLLLLLCRFVPVVDRYVLVKWIWKISRKVDDGCSLVNMTMYGTEAKEANSAAAKLLAEEVFSVTRSAQAMEALAGFEISNKNYIGANDYIVKAEQAGCDDMHHLLMIKLYCAEHLDEYQSEEIVEEMLSCNCLSMAHTREALLAKANILLDKNDYTAAEEIADHLLAVREDAYARYFKGIVSLNRNQDETARSNFLKSRGNMPKEEFHAVIGMTYINNGRKQEGMEWLFKAVNAGFNVTQGNGVLWEVYNSKEYADYCAMRN
jgi:hypothetical protein